ncbi:MAG: hypothetical protein ACK5X8_13035, partial [Planctomyces sp.]
MSSIAEKAVAVVSGASGQGAEQRAELSRLFGLTVNFLAPQTASRFAGHFSVDLHTAALADKAALHEDGNSHHEIAHGITLSRGWGLGNQGTKEQRNEERGTRNEERVLWPGEMG